jgi:hypothetical protein
MARLTPIDYQMQVINPMSAALQGYQAGFGQMQQLDQVRRQREADEMAKQRFEAEMAQTQEEVQTALGDIWGRMADGENVTVQDLQRVQSRFPEVADQLQSLTENLTAQERSDKFFDTVELVSLAQTPELYRAELNQRIEASESNPEQQRALQAQLQAYDAAEQAQEGGGAAYARMVGGMSALQLADNEQQRELVSQRFFPEPEAPQTMLAKARQDLELGFIDQREFDDLAEKLTAVPDTGVSVHVGGASEAAEIERAKAVAGALVENYQNLQDIGQTAQRNMPRLNQLASIIEDFTPGASARARVAIRSATGISIGEDMDDLQVFEALVNQLVPQQRPPGSGTMSDADLALFKNSLPSLVGTKEGNRVIIETMIAINQYDIEAGKIARRAMIDPNYTDEMAFAAQDELYERMNPLGAFENAVSDSDLFGGF